MAATDTPLERSAGRAWRKSQLPTDSPQPLPMNDATATLASRFKPTAVGQEPNAEPTTTGTHGPGGGGGGRTFNRTNDRSATCEALAKPKDAPSELANRAGDMHSTSTADGRFKLVSHFFNRILVVLSFHRKNSVSNKNFTDLRIGFSFTRSMLITIVSSKSSRSTSLRRCMKSSAIAPPWCSNDRRRSLELAGRATNRNRKTTMTLSRPTGARALSLRI